MLQRVMNPSFNNAGHIISESTVIDHVNQYEFYSPINLDNHSVSGADSHPMNENLKNPIEMPAIPNIIVNDIDHKNRTSPLESFQNKLQLVQEINQRKDHADG